MISAFQRNRHFKKVLVNKTFTNVQEQKKAMWPRHSAYIPSSVKSPLDIAIFSETSDFENSNSKMATNQLCEKIIQQKRQYDRDNNIKEKNKITDHQQRLNDINQEPGASSWISSLSSEDEGYVLNKQLFWDLTHIRYDSELNAFPKIVYVGCSMAYPIKMVDLLQFDTAKSETLLLLY